MNQPSLNSLRNITPLGRALLDLKILQQATEIELRLAIRRVRAASQNRLNRRGAETQRWER